jgi:hypothetical protein
LTRLDERLLQGKKNSGHDFFIEAALIATWEIWKMRNDKIFDRHTLPLIDGSVILRISAIFRLVESR